MSILNKIHNLLKKYDEQLKTYLKHDKNIKKLIEIEMIDLLKKNYQINSINDIDNISFSNLSNYFYKSINNLRDRYILFVSDDVINMYNDPTVYTESEKGNNYVIHKKLTNKKKIISEGIFRMNNRNTRLPEYLSGIMCTVNNLPNTMGQEWGYRIYIDTQFLKKNQIKTTITEEGTKYEYNDFNKNEIEEWKTLFEDRDEGLIFYKFLEQLNQIDYVEIFKVELTDKFHDNNNYVVGLFGTNYRFHASLDKSKDVVYMKDGDWGISSEIADIWKTFENSDKTVTYYFFPWYKPSTHALIQYPFTIIAYFWGIKPSQYWSKYEQHYSFDSILDYFINFNDNNNENNFFMRNKSINLTEKASYGSDEIILTDLIFSGIKTSETKPFAQKYDFNTILLFYIFYESYSENLIFKDILNKAFDNMKTKINEIKKTENINLKNWNIDNLDNFLFGDNNLCCILPYYNNIPDRYRTKLFYMAYNKMLYDIVENNKYMNMNYRYEYFNNIINNIKYYNSNLEAREISDEEINEDIFNHTFTNHSGWSPSDNNKRIMLPNNNKYLFNRYYNIKTHIPAIFNTSINSKEPFLDFISEVISMTNNSNILDITIKEIYDLYFVKNKTGFFQPLWINTELNKKIDICRGKLTLVGGSHDYGSNSYGSNSYGYVSNRYGSNSYGSNRYGSNSYGYGSYYKNFDCINGDYPIKIINIDKPNYYTYKDIYKPILLNNEKKSIIKSYFISDYDNNIFEFIKRSTFNPIYHAILWKLLSCIINENFILFDNDNSLAYMEHNIGQYPWDNDIDIAYITDENYVSYIDFLKNCIKMGLEVFVDAHEIENGDVNVEKLTLENANNYNKNNLSSSKITITQNTFNILSKKLNLYEKYYIYGDKESLAIPGINLVPCIKNDITNKLIINHNSSHLNVNSEQFRFDNIEHINIYGINIYKPANLSLALNKYKNLKITEEGYNEKIYDYINHTYREFNYGIELKKHVKNYIQEHSKRIIDIMNKITCEDLYLSQLGGNDYHYKYLKYKAKYLKLRHN